MMLTRLAYTVQEAKEVVGLSQTKIRRMVRDGALPAVRCGKRVLIPRAALEKLLQHGTDHRAAR
ncbi:MAG: helix-turn-helix domain-containing protein [Bacillota bacterium]